MKKYLLYFLFISLELSLFILIIVLAVKIKSLSENRVKGVQYVTQIKKEDLVFDSSDLKHFYEPKPNNIEIWNPDWLGYEAKNTINSDGLNERYDYSTQKPSNTYRIITLGDSFTFGHYVYTSENYSELLEDKLNKELKCSNVDKFEVINLGVYGYDIEYEVERFKKRGIKYNPDLVFWLIGEGNFLKINELIIPVKKTLEKEGIKDYDPRSKRSLSQIEAIDSIKNALGNTYIINYQLDKFSLINNIYHNKLVIFPLSNISENIHENIKKTIQVNSNYMYIQNLFPYLEDKKFQLPDKHPNKEGHKKIAADLFTYLKSNILTSCR